MKKIFFVLFIIFLLTDTDTYSSEMQDKLHHRSWWIEKYGVVDKGYDPLAARAEMIFQRVSMASDKTGKCIPRLLIIKGGGRSWVTSIRDGSVILTHGALRVCYKGVSKENGDSRLAFVLGHELAHLSKDEYWHAFAFADLDDKEISEELEDQLEEIRDISRDKSVADEMFKEKELQADSYGMISMASAGYDPGAIIDNDNINFFEDWIAQTKRNITYEDSQHPDPKVRAEFLRLRLDDVVKLLDCFTFGVTLYQIGRYEDAILLFDTFREQFPGREVFSNLGLSYYQIAIKALSFCDADLPYRFKLSTFIDPETYAVKLRGFGESDCFKDKVFLRYIKRALEYLKLAVDKDHTYLPARINMSSALIMAGEYSRAISVTEEVLRIDRENAEALNNNAVALYLYGLSNNIDTVDKAIEIMRKVVGLNHNFGNPVYNIATIYSERGDASASDTWKAFLKIESTGDFANAARRNLGIELKENDVAASLTGPELPFKPGEEIKGELEKMLGKMKVREFSIGGSTIEIYEENDLRILARDFIVEVVEKVYDKGVRTEEFKTEYGKPLRVMNKYGGGAILIYDDFAVDVIDEKVRKVIYFKKKQGKWYG